MIRKFTPLYAAHRTLRALCFCLAGGLLAPALAFAQDSAPPPMLPGFPGGAPDDSLPAGPAPAPGQSFYEDQDFALEKSTEALREEARKEAFDAALEGLLPLRPEEIRTLLEHFDRTRESVEVPIYPDPKPEVAVETIPLDPGTKPATIKTAYGHITTLNVLDASGSPWPIEDLSWAGDFEIIETSASEGSHILRISPQSEFARGNMSIRLLTLKTPVIISLETSRSEVHYRFDAIIPEYGPMGNIPLIQQGLTISTAGNENMASFLEGVVPGGARKLNVSGVDGRTSAYTFDSRTYVRTPLTLLSPGWERSVSSADGTHVYAIQASPVLLLSDNGRMVRARLSEREDVFDEQ